MPSQTLKLTKDQIKKIQDKLKNYQINLPNPNLHNCYKYKSVTLSLYKTGNLVFQGKAVDHVFNELKSLINNTSKLKPLNLTKAIGCDESGVGDYFGGIAAAAVVIKNGGYNFLINAKIQDSKKLSDASIKQLVPIIQKHCYVGIASLDASEYNKLYDKYQNAHIIKTYAHNLAINRLKSQSLSLKNIPIIMDQFADQKLYQAYLDRLEIANDQKQQITIFETKAESKYLQVACASIIARYEFIKQIESLSQRFGLKVPYGANKSIISKAIERIESKKTINKNLYLKKHFKI